MAGVAQTRTRSSWCPPAGDGPLYQWTIDFHCRDEYWSTQSAMVGGPPDGADLEQLLREWCQDWGRPAATWRLRVTRGDEVIGYVERWFDARTPTVTRWGRDRGVAAPPCWAEDDAPS
jgi:hypothetical protein